MTSESGSEPHAHQPVSSLWPIVLAAGITLLLFGLLTSVAFSAAGLATIAAALGGWIAELRHESS